MRTDPLAIACALFFLATEAVALSIDPSEPEAVHRLRFGGEIDGRAVDGLSALADVALVSFEGRRLVLDVALTNRSRTDRAAPSRVSGFAFDVSSGVSAASVSDGVFGGASTGGRFANGSEKFDVCIADHGRDCRRGRDGGVDPGSSGTTRVVLELASEGPVELSHFTVRYQEMAPEGGFGFGTAEITPGIPEPSALLVFGLGAVMVRLAARGGGRP